MAGAATGGAELFFERLCMGLQAAGEPVLPVIRHNAGRAGRLRAAGMQARELGFGGPFDVATRWGLRRVLRAAAPSVVVAWMGRAAAVVPRGPWTLVGRLGGYYDLRRFARCAHLVGNTPEIVAWIVGQGWDAARVHHLPNFVPDLGGCRAVERAALGVPDGAWLVLGLGRLHAVKGFETLIRALPELPGVHAVIAGDGAERGVLMRLAGEQGVAGRVHLPGWRRDTGALLAACDVLVCPSRQEPLGNVVLEGWSAGRPVIATAAEGPRALIRDGVDGLLTPIGDAGGLRTAIAAVRADPARARSLAAAGRARYEGGYTLARVVNLWREFLAAVAP